MSLLPGRRTLAAMVRWVAVCVLGAVAACGSERPYFQSVSAPTDTYDTVGPYRVEAWIVAPRGVGIMELRFEDEANRSSADFPMQEAEVSDEASAELWVAELTGRPVGTVLRFYLVLVDQVGQKVVYPAGAPADVLNLKVVGQP